MLRRSDLVYLVLLISSVVALMLRATGLDASLWLDELHTAWVAVGSSSDVVERASLGNQPPLYFFLARGMVWLFGKSELALRLPSLIAGLILGAVLAWLAWRWTKTATASLAVAIFVAIDPNLIFYSQEARSYALLQLVAWCHVWMVWRLSHSPTIAWRLGFVAGSVLMFYLHYTAALFWAGEVAWLAGHALRPSTENGYRIRQLSTDLILVVLGCLPAAEHLREVAARRDAWQMFVPAPSWSGTIRLFRMGTYFLWPLIVLVVAAARTKIGLLEKWRMPDRRALILVLLVLLLPSALAWLAAESTDTLLFYRRYLVASYAAVPLLTAVVCGSLPSPVMRGIAVGGVVMLSLWNAGTLEKLWNAETSQPARRQDWRGAIEFVQENRSGSPREMAWVRSGLIESERLVGPHDPRLDLYCLMPVQGLYRLGMIVRPLPLSISHTFEPAWFGLPSNLSQLDRAWFMINGSAAVHRRFEAELDQQIQATGISMHRDTRREFGDVLVLRYVTRRRPAP